MGKYLYFSLQNTIWFSELALVFRIKRPEYFFDFYFCWLRVRDLTTFSRLTSSCDDLVDHETNKTKLQRKTKTSLLLFQSDYLQNTQNSWFSVKNVVCCADTLTTQWFWYPGYGFGKDCTNSWMKYLQIINNYILFNDLSLFRCQSAAWSCPLFPRTFHCKCTSENTCQDIFSFFPALISFYFEINQ